MVKKYDLEERLIDFAVLMVEIVMTTPKTLPGMNLASQLNRSGTSPALNYAEAKDAESTKDFIHKLKLVLKELRETHVCLKIIKQTKLYADLERINNGINEANELISIFVTSIKTTRGNSSSKQH